MKTDIYMGAPWWREELALTNHDVQVVEDGDLAVSMRDNGWLVGYRVHPIIGIRYLETPDLPIITENLWWVGCVTEARWKTELTETPLVGKRG